MSKTIKNLCDEEVFTKKLCMVLHVWGWYKEYIPIYLYFLGTLYPEYEAIIYVDGVLGEEIDSQLSIVRKVYDKFEIVENLIDRCSFSKEAQKLNQVMKCQRWLEYDERFAKYEAVYFGDIDILICPEEKPIFESHLEHCRTINRVYSNAKRTKCKRIRKRIMNISRNIREYGFRQTVQAVFNISDMYRLSGLHFVLVKPYFAAVRPLFEKYRDEIEKMVVNRPSIFNGCVFNNEAMLRTLVMEAGLGDAYNIDGCARFDEMGYRSLHGIHVGRYREMVNDDEEDYYARNKGFYDYFEKMENTEIYKELECHFSMQMRAIIDNLKVSIELSRKKNDC